MGFSLETQISIQSIKSGMLTFNSLLMGFSLETVSWWVLAGLCTLYVQLEGGFRLLCNCVLIYKDNRNYDFCFYRFIFYF